MFPMTPAMSWLLMIVLALLIAVPLTVAYLVRRRRAIAELHEPRLAPVIELRPRPVPAERTLAIVPELRALERSRHLHLVSSRPEPAKPIALYDWAKQGD